MNIFTSRPYAVNKMSHSFTKIDAWWDGVRVSEFETLVCTLFMSTRHRPRFPRIYPYMTPHISQSRFFRPCWLADCLCYHPAHIHRVYKVRVNTIQVIQYFSQSTRTNIYIFNLSIFPKWTPTCSHWCWPFASSPTHRMVGIWIQLLKQSIFKLVKSPFLLSILQLLYPENISS